MRVKYIVMIFVSVVIICAVILLAEANSNRKLNNIIIGNLSVAENYAYQLNLSIISDVATQIANANEYKRGVYDCTQFSIELKDRLKELGFNASCVAGYTKDLYVDGTQTGGNTLHTWVEVDTGYGLIEVEATNGQIIDSDVFEDRYVILKRGLCW